MTFGTREAVSREHTIAEMSYTCLQVARDMGHETTVLICQRVIAQLRTKQSPKLGDVRAIRMALSRYFR
jgi:hypothetical protein